MAAKGVGVILVFWLLASVCFSQNVKVCPLYCLEVEYMTCKSTGNEKLYPGCTNCCFLAGKGCTLYFSSGNPQTCPT
ncbi:hypothetical protein RHSIM_Rhsim11G0055100 [Rhododendron simsii]|uniref:Uncharacterized protein n=1 Tax=Rhododendron simsii TaxID=118357 RepID=A0A834G7P6_RHOSS|nr:hypothetical protein RHSIM_Rhsim11G0055100 [Rhododendron simsii]